MANDLSVVDIEMGLRDLSHQLTDSDWNDDVMKSYQRFIAEEQNLLYSLSFTVNTANSEYNGVCSVDVQRFKSAYAECLAKFDSLQGGG